MSGANEVKLEELIQQALAGGGGGEGGGAGAAAAGGDAGEDDCGVAGQVSKTYNLQVVKHYKLVRLEIMLNNVLSTEN